MIDIRDVSYEYPTKAGALRVLDRISLTIREGEFVSFIGPSGCGKSTLLALLADLKSPQSGTLTIRSTQGRAIRQQNLYSIIFQEVTLLDWLTVQQNIELPVTLNPALRYIDAKDMLEQVGLLPYRSLYPHQLSGGMKTRVSIARALMANTPALLIDECFASLDEVTREQMNLFLLKILGQIKRTVIFITHSIAEAAFMSDRVVVFSSKPSRVLADIAIDIPRPRRLEDIENPDYTAYRKTLRTLLNQSAESQA
ncbi:ABC transporter related protein [Candidatus Moduliflexus flocculans]|uniref:ABC transporter related protein n=1 Tax=Candidatus Moduliflexus flocculans TaxID=1499966 RepID=A0A081BMS0_9BACT|nr:ABC transporter related protein [Candidatus Moduliflexus flocculans]